MIFLEEKGAHRAERMRTGIKWKIYKCKRKSSKGFIGQEESERMEIRRGGMKEGDSVMKGWFSNGKRNEWNINCSQLFCSQLDYFMKISLCSLGMWNSILSMTEVPSLACALLGQESKAFLCRFPSLHAGNICMCRRQEAERLNLWKFSRIQKTGYR